MESIGDGKHASDRNSESTKQMLEIVEKPAYENDNHLVVERQNSFKSQIIP